MSKRSYSDAFKTLAGNHDIPTSIAINLIRIDGGTQARVQLDEVVINEYAEIMLVDDKFPPIVVFKDSESIYWLADGFHRYFAQKKIGRSSIICEVKIGELREAILHSLSANTSHGLRRTNEDKRKAVLTLLDDAEWQNFSTNELAKYAGVTQQYISKMKNELGIKSDSIIGADGRAYKTANLTNKVNKIERTKFYRIKTDLEYKEIIQKAISVSKKNEKALIKEALEYIRNKYIKGDS